MRLAAVSGTQGFMSEQESARTAKAFTAEQKSARSTGKFCPAGDFFLWFVSFFLREERNEHTLKSLCAEREKGIGAAGAIPRSGIRQMMHYATKKNEREQRKSAKTLFHSHFSQSKITIKSTLPGI